MGESLKVSVSKSHLFALGVVVVGIVARVIPHIANFSPEIVFAFYLGASFYKRYAFLFVLVMAVVSDVIIGTCSGYPTFGTWTVFTYSALIIACILGAASPRVQKYHKVFFVSGAFGVTLFYWGWTNFGTWVAGGLYPHTWAGLLSCYVLAIPFLKTSIVSSVLWCAVILTLESILKYQKVTSANKVFEKRYS